MWQPGLFTISRSNITKLDRLELSANSSPGEAEIQVGGGGGGVMFERVLRLVSKSN